MPPHLRSSWPGRAEGEGIESETFKGEGLLGALRLLLIFSSLSSLFSFPSQPSPIPVPPGRAEGEGIETFKGEGLLGTLRLLLSLLLAGFMIRLRPYECSRKSSLRGRLRKLLRRDLAELLS